MRCVTELKEYHTEKQTAVTLGKFDGLHRGHQELIQRIKNYAAKEKTESVVFAFDMGREALMTQKEKRAHLEHEVDTLLICPFTTEIRGMKAEEFIERILVKQLHASYIVVGTDFHFGYQKRGDVQMLQHYAKQYGYQVDVVEKAVHGNREISSTYIREALKNGNVELAEELLGYRYRIDGIVEHGKQIGRTLGFPTLNVAWKQEKTAPRFGVYACRVKMDGIWYHGIGNLGIKPTVTEEKRLLTEVYVFGYKGDAYGKCVEIEFCAFERPESKFSSLEELKHQVDRDLLFGREYFQTR